MDTIESLGLIWFAGIIVLACIAIFTSIAIVTTQAKQRYAKEILKEQARGAFKDLETPNDKFRFRLFAGIALLGVVGTTLSIGVLVLQVATKFSNPYWITIGIALIFSGIGAVAGFLMRREITRRQSQARPDP